ncbi:ArnT family glycosyltransferase [Elusimicrobiota bacterium]
MTAEEGRTVPLRAIAIALAAVFLADYLYTAWTWLAWNRHSGFAQDSWLLYALAVKEGRSVPMGNDLPLYPFILSLWAGRDPSAFTWSKLFSLAWSAATLAAVYRVGSSLFDRRTALLAGLALSVNWIFLSFSMSLRAEIMLPLLFLMNWYCTWQGFSEGKGQWWLAAGVFAGLAFLTKGTATLLVAAWGGAFVVASIRDRGLWRRAPWLLAGFLPLAAILWWGNLQMFGDPAYNFSVRHAMWLDSWWDLPNRSLEELTFAGYVASHGWTGVLSRIALGMVHFAPVSLACLAPSSSFPLPYTLRWLFVIAMAGVLWGARGRIRSELRERRGEAWFTALLLALFFFLFSWYHQVSSSERFIGPLNPILFLLLARAAVLTWDEYSPRLERFPKVKQWLPGVLAGLVALTAVTTVIKLTQWGLLDPFQADRPLDCYAKAYSWVGKKTVPVLYGPSGDLPTWQLSSRPRFVTVPAEDPPEDLAKWLNEKGARYAVVDWDMADKPFLSGHFKKLGDRGVLITRPLPGWRVIDDDRAHRLPHLLLLERDP